MEKKSRSELLKESTKKNRFKRWIIGIITIFVLALITSGVFYVLSYVNEKATKKQMMDGQTQLIQILTKKEFKDAPAVEKTVAATSSSPKRIELSDKTLPESVKTTSQDTLKKALTKWKTDKDDIIVSYNHIEPVTKKANQVNTGVELFQWNIRKKAYEVKKKANVTPTFINSTDETPVTAKTVLQDKDANLAVVRLATQKLYLDRTKDKDSVLEDIFNLPTFTWDTPIDYYGDHLVVHIPDTGNIKKQTIDIPYTEIANAVDPDYVDSTMVAKFPETPAPSDKKQIALTFDDGPNPSTTPGVLDALKAKNVKATFFELGQNASYYPNLVKRVHDEGHQIGSHTFHHLRLTSLTPEALQKELSDTDRAIYKATGVIPSTIRPPYGATNATVGKVAGRPLIMWNIDSLDWKLKDTALTFENIKKMIIKNGIILMHDIHPTTVAMIPELIDWLQSQGYELVTVDQLLQNNEKPFTEYFGQKDFREVS